MTEQIDRDESSRVIGNQEPFMGRETATIDALCQFFATDRQANTTMNSDQTDINGGLRLSDPFASGLSIGIAWEDLLIVAPDQAQILHWLYCHHLSRGAIHERKHIHPDRIAYLESAGLTQLIRWLWDDKEYKPMLRTFKRTRRKDTPEWKDWERFRMTDGYKVWLRMRKRRMGV